MTKEIGPSAKDKTPIRDFAEYELDLVFIKERGSELNFECPFCADGKPGHFNVNAESGLWNCFKCGEKGSLSQLVDKLGEQGNIGVADVRKLKAEAQRLHDDSRISRVRSIFGGRSPVSAPPSPVIGIAADICASTGPREGKKYLFSRIPQKTARRFRIGFVPKSLVRKLAESGISEKDGLDAAVLRDGKYGVEPRWTGAIVIPYVVDGQVVTLEYRILDPALAKNYGKYQALPGKRSLYNQDALKSADTILVCEGAFDTMTAESLGVTAVGIPGNASFKREWGGLFAKAGVKRAVLCLDNGEEGTAAGRSSAREILEKSGVEVFDLTLPEEVGDLNEYRTDRGGTEESLKQLVDEALSSTPTASSSSTSRTTGKTSSLPMIATNDRQSREIVDEAADAILEANEKELLVFRRDVELVRVRRSHVPRIDVIQSSWLEKHLDRIADWVVVGPKGFRHVRQPSFVVRGLLAEPDPRLKNLEAAVSVPFFDRAGRLINAEGYHESERVYLVPPGDWRMPKVPTRPSGAELDRARALLLDDLFVDFAFVGQADRAHAVAAMILPFVRCLIAGPTPMHLCEAPGPGVGKTLLWTVVAVAFLGDFIQATVLPRSDEETRKRITAQLSTGAPFILFDNVDRDERGHRVESSALAAALSSVNWTDRRLGASEVIECANRATWLMTGNNVQLSMELSRRLVLTRLDAKTDEPWRRDGFKHDDLRGWAVEHRVDLVWAVLTLVQAWVVAGQPKSTQKLGSFEDWAAKMGGILDVAGIEGFLGNLDDLYEAADSESSAWREFVRAWWAEFKDKPCSPSDLLKLCDEEKLLQDDLGEKGDHGKVTWLGGELARQRDRVYAGYRIVQAKDRGPKKGRTYKVLPVAGESREGTSEDVRGRSPEDAEDSSDE